MIKEIRIMPEDLPPGPWKVEASTPNDGFECFYVVAADGSVVIEVPGPQNESQERLASAIAFIPDLLKCTLAAAQAYFEANPDKLPKEPIIN